MGAFMVWVLFGGITAAVASSRGRRGWLWLIIGMVFGPIGFILSFIVPKIEPSGEQEVLAPDTEKEEKSETEKQEI